MQRRQFLELLATFALFGCGKDSATEALRLIGSPQNGSPADGSVILYDVYAMATYFDGSLGPKTGVLKVEDILKNAPLDLKFWHGHGGRDHRFVVEPKHFAQLKKLKRVILETTPVDGHTHKLFIDPVDPKYRVPGAKPIEVPVDSRINFDS